MIELNDVVLEGVTGGHGRGNSFTVNTQKTNNSTIILYNFSVKEDGGLSIGVTQKIG